MTEYIYISSNNSPFYSNIKTGKVSIVTFIDLYRRWPWYTKVKCTLVQALRLCTGRTAHRGSGGVALLFHDHGTRRWWGVSVTPRPLFTHGKDTVPIVQEAGWAPGPVWTGAENLARPWYTSDQNTVHLRLSDLPGGKGDKVARGSLPGPQLGFEMQIW